MISHSKRRDLRSLDIPAKSSLGDRLASAARLPDNSGARIAILKALSCAVEKLELKLPIDAAEIFSPLQTEGAFFQHDSKVTVSLYAALQIIARNYFAPRSPVVASLLGPRASAKDEAQLREEYTDKTIDLFSAAGGGAVEALLVIMDGGGAEGEAEWSSRWWSAFWRHCVAGDGATRFLLTPSSGGFVLDESFLDGPDLLMENVC